MSSPVAGGSISAILAEFRQQPELSPLAAELLWQAVGALRSAVRRVADTELEDLIAGASGTGDGVALPAIPQDEGGGAGQTLADATARFQVQHIRRTIEQSDGNMSRAADRLGLNRSNLYRKMRQLGMALPEGGSGEGSDSGSGVSL